MKFTIKTGAWWVRDGYGVVLYPFCAFGDKQPNEGLIRHEFEHCYQISREGVFRFYFLYLLHLIKHGYKKHPFEIEARVRSSDGLNDAEREQFENRELTIEA